MAPWMICTTSLVRRFNCNCSRSLRLYRLTKLATVASLAVLSPLQVLAVPSDNRPTAFFSSVSGSRSTQQYHHHNNQHRQQRRDISVSMSKLDSPSAQRNKEPIWSILSSKVLPLLPTKDGPRRVLEIAAGCGVHSHHFSMQLLQHQIPFQWYPTDPEAVSRDSIQAYLQEEPDLHGSLQPPQPLTLNQDGVVQQQTGWNEAPLDLMICINMIHISPWEATLGLMKVAGKHLKQPGGVLYLYGPYKVDGEMVESNR